MKWRKLILLTSSVLFLASVLNSCFYDEIVPEPQRVIQGGVSFSDNIIPILNSDCNYSGCHNSGGVPPDLSPSAAYNVLVSGNYVNTDSPEDSELYQWMLGNRGLVMPVSGTNSFYNSMILQWITEGAKNN